MHPKKKRLLFGLILVAGLVLVAEGILQVLALSSRSVRATLSVDTIHAYVADRELVWRGNPEFPQHDRLGFRNPDVPSQTAIVALGDSLTYGSKVPRDQAWPHQLAKLERIGTYNMAFPGWGPLQTFQLLDESFALKPRLIINAVYAGNDLVDSFTFVHHRKRLREFRTTDESLLRSIAAVEKADPWDDYNLADQNPINTTKSRRAKRSTMTLGGFLEAHSKLYGLGNAIRRAYVYYQRHPIMGPEEEEMDPGRDYLHFQNGHFKTVFDPSYRLTAVNLGDPRVLEGFRITVDALGVMHQRSTEANVHFAVLLIPTKELALREAVYAEMDEVPTSYQMLVDYEDDVREMLRDRLADRKIPFIDALPTLRELVRNGVLPYSATKDGHLNAAGHHAVAQLVRATIHEQDLLSEQVRG